MKKTIIVDDSRVMRKLVRKALELASPDAASDDNCLEMEDGEGVQTYIQSHPDVGLFLVDLNLPKLGGWELVPLIRKMSAYTNTPIVVITSEAGAGIEDQLKQAGANEYVRKPFMPDVLAQVIKKFL